MLRKMLPAALLLGAAGLLLGRAPVASDSDAPTIEKSIEQLGSKDFVERSHAFRQLRMYGFDALPALRKATDHPDAEVRHRVNELLLIQKMASYVEPTHVTLNLENQPLAVVLCEIENQTGNKIAIDGETVAESSRRYTYAMKRVPFWEALETVRRDAGRMGPVIPLAGKVELKKGHKRSALVSFSGPFRFEAIRLQDFGQIDFATLEDVGSSPRGDHRLLFTFTIQAEPRLRLLRIGPPNVEEALDADGKPLEVCGDADVPELKGRNQPDPSGETLEIRLRRSADQCGPLKALRGTVHVCVLMEPRPVVVTDDVQAAVGTTARMGKDTVEICSAGLQADGKYHVELEIVDTSRKSKLTDWLTRLHIEDSSGHRYEPISQTTTESASDPEGKCESRVKMTYAVDEDSKLGPPTTLIIDDWTVIDYPVAFEFKNVPLP